MKIKPQYNRLRFRQDLQISTFHRLIRIELCQYVLIRISEKSNYKIKVLEHLSKIEYGQWASVMNMNSNIKTNCTLS